MFKPKLDINELAGEADVVARVVLARHLFSLTTRSVRVPEGWTAMVTRSGRDPLRVQAGMPLDADENLQDVMLARTIPITCAAQDDALHSANGFACRGSIQAAVRILPDSAELTVFRKTIIGQAQAVSVTDVERYLQWPMRSVLADLATRLPAAELVQALEPAMIDSIAARRLGPACLAAGLAIDGAVSAQFESPGWQQHCRDQAQTARQQRRLAARTQLQQALTAARNEHLDHLVQLLGRMRDAAGQAGNLDLAPLLRTFTDAERGELYAALWHLCPHTRPTRFAAAVSGHELLLFEPGALDRPARRITLPDDLGALRSIRVDNASLEDGLCMIGAGRGVFLLDIESGQVRDRLVAEVDDPDRLHGGVNAAAMSDRHVFATHSELGLLRWPRDDAQSAPAASWRPDLIGNADTVRAARIDHAGLWFTVDHVLWSLPLAEGGPREPQRYAASDTTITAIAITADTVYAGNLHGQIIAWDHGDPESARIVRGPTGAPVESIDVLDTAGLERLIVADRQNALIEMIVGDNYARRYEAGPHLVRRAAAAGDLLIAMTDHRDRLIAWNPSEPERPAAEVIIPHLTRQPVQDICLIPGLQCHSACV